MTDHQPVQTSLLGAPLAQLYCANQKPGRCSRAHGRVAMRPIRNDAFVDARRDNRQAVEGMGVSYGNVKIDSASRYTEVGNALVKEPSSGMHVTSQSVTRPDAFAFTNCPASLRIMVVHVASEYSRCIVSILPSDSKRVSTMSSFPAKGCMFHLQVRRGVCPSVCSYWTLLKAVECRLYEKHSRFSLLFPSSLNENCGRFAE